MKRSNKLYEARAIVSQLQTKLMLEIGQNPLKLKMSDRERLGLKAKTAYDALENLQCEIEELINEMNAGARGES